MAIALDVLSSGASTTTSPITISHNCSGSNRVLVVAFYSVYDEIPTATYNGVSMTLGKSQDRSGTFKRVALFYLINPPTGAHNIVVSWSTDHTNGYQQVFGMSLTGCDQSVALGGTSGQDLQTPNGAQQQTITTSTTLQKSNSWLIEAWLETNLDELTPNSGQTVQNKVKNYNATNYLYTSTRASSGATNTSVVTANSSPEIYVGALIEIMPPSTNYTLSALMGSFTLTGSNASFNKSLHLLATYGQYTLTGFNAILTKAHGYAIQCLTGNYTLTGFNSLLSHVRHLVASVGNYTITGFNASFQKAIRLTVQVGKYVITGFNATFIAPFHTSWKGYTPTQSSWKSYTPNQTSWKTKNKGQ